MKLQITTEAYQNILKTIASQEVEKGGVLIGKNGIITDFIFDENAHTTRSTYSLNVGFLNPIIKEFKQQGKLLMGIIHSHPYGCPELSHLDRDYFLKQFKNFPDLDFMYTPIVFSAKQEEFAFFPYVFYKDGTVEIGELEILPNNYEQYTRKVEDPTPDTATQTQEVLVIINNETQVHFHERERQQELEPLQLIMLFSNLYFFLLGLATAIVPLTFFYIIKNL
jgi:proteasome lid subunit RPN8/RPN11